MSYGKQVIFKDFKRNDLSTHNLEHKYEYYLS